MGTQTNETSRRILYSNTEQINATIDGYKKAVSTLQGIINNLKSEGVPITDEILIDLYDREGEATTAALKLAIDAEVKHQKFPAMKDTIRKQLKPLYTTVVKAVEAVEASLYYVPLGGYPLSLDLDHFTFKDLKVSLIEGLEQIVTDENTIYSDTDPVLTEAYERAEKLNMEIADFNSWLRGKGDFVTPIGIRGQTRSFLNVITSPSYRIDLEPKALLWVKKRNG